MPRTAVCFSGELRSIDQTLPLIERHILNRFSDWDVFYFTWADDPDMRKLKHMLRLHPKNIGIEPRKDFDEEYYFPNKHHPVDYHKIVRQLYCLKAVNDLKCEFEKEHNFKYDIVVRIRPDLEILDGSLPRTFERRDFSSVHLLDHDNWHGFCDRFYVTNSANGDILANRIEGQRHYSLLGGSQQYESFFQFTTILHDIPVQRIDDLKTCLLRPDGTREGEIIALRNGTLEWRIEPELKELRLFHVVDGNFI